MPHMLAPIQRKPDDDTRPAHRGKELVKSKKCRRRLSEHHGVHGLVAWILLPENIKDRIAPPHAPLCNSDDLLSIKARFYMDEHDGPQQFDLTGRKMRADANLQDHALPKLLEIVEKTVERSDTAKYFKDLGLSSGYAGTQSSENFLKMFEGSELYCSPRGFLLKILKDSACDTCVLVIGLLYLHRLNQRLQRPSQHTHETENDTNAAHHSREVLNTNKAHGKADGTLTTTNVKRLVIVAVMISAKVWNDHHFSNARWATIGGMGLRSLNSLELEFLLMMEFDLHIAIDDYKNFLHSILRAETLQDITLADRAATSVRESACCCTTTTNMECSTATGTTAAAAAAAATSEYASGIAASACTDAQTHKSGPVLSTTSWLRKKFAQLLAVSRC